MFYSPKKNKKALVTSAALLALFSALNMASPLFGNFMGAVAAFRSLDWLFYTFCVEALRFPLVIAGRDCYYLAYQLANVVIFSLAKFVFCRRAIEGSRP